MKEPLYTKGDRVEFLFNGSGETMTGIIGVVDAAGTLFDRTEASYDVWVPEKNCVYKHVLESHIIKVCSDEALLRGILVCQEETGSYGVEYNKAGYTAVIDNPVFTEIRLAGMEEWVPVSLILNELPEHVKEDWMQIPVASLKEWVGRKVEIRHKAPWFQVCELIHTHQDDEDMVYEVYREDANVVLLDGGWFLWNPENLVLRGAKHHVVKEYYSERVYRWDVADGVMRLCLGHIADPDPETLADAKKYIRKRELGYFNQPDVPAEKKMVLERVRIEEFQELGLKRMISCANYIGRTKKSEILTPVTQHGFTYRIGSELHRVYYQPGFIVDVVVSEEGAE